jgi:ABC-type multidrug transport system ATPase subunit
LCLCCSVLDKKTKSITRGQLRRLSIAEEIVHGPSLILLDEPITGLESKDAAIIMSATLRELVNQERTVIASFHQVTSCAHSLFPLSVL